MNGSSMALCNDALACTPLLAIKLFAFFNGSWTIGVVLGVVVLIDVERIVKES